MTEGSDEPMKKTCLRVDIPFYGPPLLPGDIHIWWARLDHLGFRLEKHEQVLAADERARAERFRFERDRNRFIASRGVLREILGCYLGIEPNAVRLTYGKHGKPKLVEEMVSRNIEFSLSHSEGIALYGFSHDHQIGVDIEYVREVPEMDQIAGQFFSEGEKQVLRNLHAREKMGAFFEYWTTKESVLKADGRGLFAQMEDVVVKHGRVSLDGTTWFLRELDLGPYYSCHLATNIELSTVQMVKIKFEQAECYGVGSLKTHGPECCIFSS